MRIVVGKGCYLGKEVTIGADTVREASGQFQTAMCRLYFFAVVRVRPNLFIAERFHRESLRFALQAGQ